MVSSTRNIISCQSTAAKSATRADEAHTAAYRLWRVNEALQRVAGLIAIIMTSRFTALVLWSPEWCHLHSFGVLVVAAMAAATWHVVRDGKDRDIFFCVGAQVLLLLTAQLVSFLGVASNMSNDFMVTRWFQGPVVLQMISPSMTYMPKEFFVGFVLPTHLLILALFQVATGGVLSLQFVVQCFMQLMVSVYVFILNDSREGQLFQSVRATEEERHRLETTQGVFQGMLDSLFDASCICSAEGRVVCSTPQLDQLLAGGGVAGDHEAKRRGPAGMLGNSLLTFCGGTEESRRMEQFLVNVTRGAEALRINLSMRTATGPAEVTLNGIRCADAGSARPQVFIGAQVIQSAPPQESQDLDDLEDTTMHLKAIMEERASSHERSLRSEGEGDDEIYDESVLEEFDRVSTASAPAVLSGHNKDSADLCNLDQSACAVDAVQPECTESAAATTTSQETAHENVQDTKEASLAPITYMSARFSVAAGQDKVTLASHIVGHMFDNRPAIKNTFIHFSQEDFDSDTEKVTLRRSASWNAESLAPLAMHQEAPNSMLSAESQAISQPSIRSTFPGAATSKRSGLSSSGRSQRSSRATSPRSVKSHASRRSVASAATSMASSWMSSAPSVADPWLDASIFVGGTTADRRVVGEDASEIVVLSKVQQAKELGLSSLGGLTHATGQCRPCLMQHWWATGKDSLKGCKFGALCSRCHEPHSEELLKSMQRQRRTFLRSRARRSQGKKQVAANGAAQ